MFLIFKKNKEKLFQNSYIVLEEELYNSKFEKNQHIQDSVLTALKNETN